jgi:hypothetical protein
MIERDVMLRRPSEEMYRGDERTRRSSVDWEAGRAATASVPIPIKRLNLPTPNLALPTVDGYTVSHSQLVDNLPT